MKNPEYRNHFSENINRYILLVLAMLLLTLVACTTDISEPSSATAYSTATTEICVNGSEQENGDVLTAEERLQEFLITSLAGFTTDYVFNSEYQIEIPQDLSLESTNITFFSVRSGESAIRIPVEDQEGITTFGFSIQEEEGKNKRLLSITADGSMVEQLTLDLSYFEEIDLPPKAEERFYPGTLLAGTPSTDESLAPPTTNAIFWGMTVQNDHNCNPAVTLVALKIENVPVSANNFNSVDNNSRDSA